MAKRAVSWEACRCVSGILRPVVVSLVAAIARRRKRRVIVVHMALRALHRRMRTRQRKRSVVVIESCQRPRGRVVALRTIRRESRWRMRRIVRRLVISLMASVARRWQRRVVVIHVALCALHCRMRTREGKRGAVVIE